MKPNKKLISTAVILILLAFAIYYFINNLADFKQLSFVSPWLLVAITMLFILNYYFIGVITSNLLRPFGVKLKGMEAFQLSIVTGFYNLITPFRGGMAARAIYLKKKYNFSYDNFMATLAASYVLIFLVASLVGMLSTLFIYISSGIFSWLIFLIFSGLFIGMVGTIVIAPKLKERKNRWLNSAIKVVNGWHLIRGNWRIIGITSILSLLQLIVGALMLYLQFKVFGININYSSALFLATIGSLGILIGITPAGLGIQEAITVFSALTIGIGTAEALSVALLGRAVSLTVLFVLGPIYSYILLNRKPTKDIKTK